MIDPSGDSSAGGGGGGDDGRERKNRFFGSVEVALKRKSESKSIIRKILTTLVAQLGDSRLGEGPASFFFSFFLVSVLGECDLNL